MKEKLKKMTNEQLVARRDELKAIGENPENRSADELEQLAEETELSVSTVKRIINRNSFIWKYLP